MKLQETWRSGGTWLSLSLGTCTVTDTLCISTYRWCDVWTLSCHLIMAFPSAFVYAITIAANYLRDVWQVCWQSDCVAGLVLISQKKIMLLQHRPVEPWDLNQGIQITSTMFIDHYMFRWNIVRSFFQFATKFSKKKRSYASPSCGTTIPEPMNSVNIYYIYYGSLHVLLEQGEILFSNKLNARHAFLNITEYLK